MATAFGRGEIDDAGELVKRCLRRTGDLIARLPGESTAVSGVGQQLQSVHSQLSWAGTTLENVQRGSGAAGAVTAQTVEACLACLNVVQWSCVRAGWALLEEMTERFVKGESWFVHGTDSSTLLSERYYSDACEVCRSVCELLLERQTRIQQQISHDDALMDAAHKWESEGARLRAALGVLRRQLSAVHLL